MTVFLISLSAWLAAAGPPVGGNASCPRPEEVTASLAAMLPDDAGSSATLPSGTGNPGGDRGEILVRGLETVVRLTDANGAIVGETVLDGACEERAHRAAALLAVWQTRLRVDTTAPSAGPRTPTPTAVVAAPAPEQKDGQRGAPAVKFGAALLASADSTGLAPMGMFEIEAQPRGGRAWGRFSLESTGEKSVVLGTGEVRWTSVTGGAGAVMDLGTGWLRTSLRGDFLVSRVSVEGNGFSANRQGTIWKAGADFGLRFQRALSPQASLWLDLSAVAWPGQQVLSVGNVANTRTLPALEGRLGLGGTFPLTP